MKKLILPFLLAGSFTVFADTTANYDWSVVATSGNQTTAQDAIVLSDGSYIIGTTTSSPENFKLNDLSIDLKDEGTKISPCNLILNKLGNDGSTVSWTINTVFGGTNFGVNQMAEVPGHDLVIVAFDSRFNAKGATEENVCKIVDAKGNVFTIPFTCPADYNPYVSSIMAIAPSDGTIKWLKKIETVYTTKTDGKYVAQPFYAKAVAATADAFYLTGYAFTQTTFPGGKVFEPKNIPAGWSGTTSGAGSSFTAKFNLDGDCIAVADETVTSEASEYNYVAEISNGKIFVGGATPSSLVVKSYDLATLTPGFAKTFELKGASDGKFTLQVKQMDLADGSIFITGAIKGGIENIATSGTMLEGFSVEFSQTDGSYIGGGIHGSGISGYYGTYVDKTSGNRYAYGYDMTKKEIVLQPFAKDWVRGTKMVLATTTGSCTCFGSVLNASNNQLLGLNRCNQAFKVGDVTVPSSTFNGMYMAWTLTDFTSAGVDKVAGDAVDSLTVKGAANAIVINAPEAVTLAIYNVAGQAVKTVTVPAGESIVALPAGLYIAAGQKVIVR